MSQLPANDLHEIDIDPGLTNLSFDTDRDLLTLAIRNLHENAVNHMTGAGTIRWFMTVASDTISLCVEDQGPGIANDELPLVTNRFFRGRGKTALGSGLGLSITTTALSAMGAKLVLNNRDDRTGLRAEIQFPRETLNARFEEQPTGLFA